MRISSPEPLSRLPEKAAAGCVQGFLRRLLCGNIAGVSPDPVESSAYTGYLSPPRFEKLQGKFEAPSPNIVARLMGLESMPEFDWVPRTPDSFGRSRSVNSLHSWLEFDPWQRSGRRVRSCASFREMPTFLMPENEDFLLLSFGLEGRKESMPARSEVRFGPEIEGKRSLSRSEGDENQERKSGSVDSQRSKSRSVENQSKMQSETKSRSVENQSKMQSERKKKSASDARSCKGKISERTEGRPLRRDEERKKNGCKRARIPVEEKSAKTRRDSNVTTDRIKLGRKRRVYLPAEKKTGWVDSSENSSPVSVLDRSFDAENDSLISEEDSSPVKPKSRAQSSMSEEEPNSIALQSSANANSSLQSLPLAQSSISTERGQNTVTSRKLDTGLPKCSSSFGDLYRLADQDIKAAKWVSRERLKTEECVEIGVELVIQVLDSLLHDAVIELLHSGANR